MSNNSLCQFNTIKVCHLRLVAITNFFCQNDKVVFTVCVRVCVCVCTFVHKNYIGFLQRISNTSLSNQLVCPLCPAQPHLQLRYDIKGSPKHIKLLHAHQSGFKITCGISGCKRTFTNFRTFQDHVSATHKHQNQFSDITNTTTSDEHQLTVVHFDSPSTSTDSLLSTDENIYICSICHSKLRNHL